MFTWECPTCGKELDVGTEQCPVCHPEPLNQPVPRPQPAPVVAAPPAQPAAQAPAAPKAAAPAEPALRPQAAPARAPQAQPQASRSGLQPSHVAIIGLVLVMAIGLAVYLARPHLFSTAGLQLENIPGTAPDVLSAGTAAQGDLQVAGIRTFYDGEYKPRVKAIVINHGETPIESVNLEVQLRAPQASELTSPLASFKIDLQNLEANESREIETDLTALGTLASLPPWQQVRIDLKPPAETARPAGSS